MKKSNRFPYYNLILVGVVVTVSLVGISFQVFASSRTESEITTDGPISKPFSAMTQEERYHAFHTNKKALSDKQYRQVAMEIERQKRLDLVAIKTSKLETKMENSWSAEDRTDDWENRVEDLETHLSKLNDSKKPNPRTVKSQMKRDLKSLREDEPTRLN